MLFARSFCIAFSFLAVAIDFARSLAVENFDLFTVADSAITNDFSLDGISTFSAESATALSNPDSIFASDPSSTEESLFADNIGETDESCHDGSFPAPSVIGRRLRLREEFDLISGGNTCVNPPKKFNEEDLNPFLRQLPELISPPDPGLQENRNICPEKDYAKHKIPVCSSGYEVDQVGIPGTTSMFTLNHATPCKFLLVALGYFPQASMATGA